MKVRDDGEGRHEVRTKKNTGEVGVGGRGGVSRSGGGMGGGASEEVVLLDSPSEDENDAPTRTRGAGDKHRGGDTC